MKKILLILLLIPFISYSQIEIGNLNNKISITGTEKVPVSGSGDPSITPNLLQSWMFTTVSHGSTPSGSDKIYGSQSGTNIYWNPTDFAGYNLITASGISLSQRSTIDVYNGLTTADNVTKTDIVLGGPLTGNTTINGAYKLILATSASGSLTMNGSWTAASATENAIDLSQTITARATASDVVRAFSLTPSLTSAAANQTLTAFFVNPTFTDANSATKYLARFQNGGTDVFVVQSSGKVFNQLTYNSTALLTNSTSAISHIINANITYQVNGDQSAQILNAPSINVNGKTSTVAYGYYYNPSITGTLGTHYAAYYVSGDVNVASGAMTISNGTSTALTVNGRGLITGSFSSATAYQLSIRNTDATSFASFSMDGTANNALYFTGSSWGGTGLQTTNQFQMLCSASGGIFLRNEGAGDIIFGNGGSASTNETFRVKNKGVTIHTQQAMTSAWAPGLEIKAGAHTGMTASTEFPNIITNTATQQWATGSLTTQRDVWLKSKTLAFVGSSTVTNPYTLYVDPPVAGTNATFTNTWAAGFNGNVHLIGLMKFAGTNTTGGGSASLGANSPASTNTAPYTWIQAISSDGSTVYIPAWK